MKNENDYDIYYWLLSISVIVNASVNVAYSFNYIHFSFDLDVIKKMVRPITYLGIYSILAWYIILFVLLISVLLVVIKRWDILQQQLSCM